MYRYQAATVSRWVNQLLALWGGVGVPLHVDGWGGATSLGFDRSHRRQGSRTRGPLRYPLGSSFPTNQPGVWGATSSSTSLHPHRCSMCFKLSDDIFNPLLPKHFLLFPPPLREELCPSLPWSSSLGSGTRPARRQRPLRTWQRPGSTGRTTTQTLLPRLPPPGRYHLWWHCLALRARQRRRGQQRKPSGTSPARAASRSKWSPLEPFLPLWRCWALRAPRRCRRRQRGRCGALLPIMPTTRLRLSLREPSPPWWRC